MLKVIIPRGIKDMIKQLQKEHQQVIEEKDAAIGLFNADRQYHDHQIQDIKYEHVQLQGDIHAKDQQVQRNGNTINHLRELYTEHAKYPGLSNLVMTVRKLISRDSEAYDEHFNCLHYVVHVPSRGITTKTQWSQEKFPMLRTFNCFEEENYVQTYKSYFGFIDLIRSFFRLDRNSIQQGLCLHQHYLINSPIEQRISYQRMDKT